MRPERLELQNFTTFRTLDETIDFADVDLFALTGPTGVGKTGVVDAICFGLYGAIPRTDGVESVISLGAGEAKVRLDFSVAGRTFTVARVVRRTKAGATTAEARLECQGDLIASGARDVTAAVERLLGLAYEHFIRCVVLPQGEFAAFLHETPANRQKLMRTLLDLGLFERVRSAARSRQKAADQVVLVFRGERDALRSVTPETLGVVEAELETLIAARARVDAILPRRTQARETLDSLQRKGEEAVAAMQVLGGLAAPDDIDIVTDGVAAIDRDIEEHRIRLVALRQTVEDVDKTLAEQPDRGDLDMIRTDRERLARLTEKAASMVETLTAARSRTQTAEEALRICQERQTEARERMRRLEREHAAHRLAGNLEVDAPCPVCHQTVVELPDHDDGPPEIGDAQLLVTSADEAVAEARRLVTESSKALVTLETTYTANQSEIADLTGRLDGRPDLVTAVAQLGVRTELEDRLLQVRKDERREIDVGTDLDRQRRSVEEGLRALRTSYVRTRDLAGKFGTPPPPVDDIRQSWAELTTWSSGQLELLDQERQGLSTQTAEAEMQLQLVVGEIRDVLRWANLRGANVDAIHIDATHVDEVGVEAIVRAHSEAESRLARLKDDLERATRLDERIQATTLDSEVAGALAGHLSARGFEPWLMSEAMSALVVGANALLDELSGGAYSLHVGDGGFSVVDHRNADEMRPAKTLSGGETFLVSLALALSLAEHVRTVAGGAAIESVFIDEGFGTLDAASLDVVAAVLHRLGERNQMVGIVTHVTELAHQMPVRFEVTRSPDGSKVRRVDR